MAAPHSRPGPMPDPGSLIEMHFAFVPAFVLAAGVRLNVFSNIAAGARTVPEIARAATASERGTRALLDALVALELLDKADGSYGLTPTAAEFLIPDSPSYIGGMWEGAQMLVPWLYLEQTIRTGKPFRRVEEQDTAEQFFPALVRTLDVINREPARRVAEALGAGASHRGMRVVDVGCGSGVWSIAIAEADPRARITAQDFPGILKETRRYLKQHGLENRYEFLPGNLKHVSFGENRFDLALLGNIVHTEGERSSRDLFGRLARALKPGGRVAIIDMIPNDQRTGPPFPLLFALEMLVNSEAGGTYTLAEYTEWLEEAGFRRVHTADIGFHSPLIIASKR